MNRAVIAIACALPVLLTTTGHALAQSASSSPASDNTRTNKDDASNRAKTADMQKNDAADLELVKRIRSSVVADKNLSTYGHNVKIVAANGTVTLNGVVRSADEKSQVGAKATAIAGQEHVVNDLKVQPQK